MDNYKTTLLIDNKPYQETSLDSNSTFTADLTNTTNVKVMTRLIIDAPHLLHFMFYAALSIHQVTIFISKYLILFSLIIVCSPCLLCYITNKSIEASRNPSSLYQ